MKINSSDQAVLTYDDDFLRSTSSKKFALPETQQKHSIAAKHFHFDSRRIANSKAPNQLFAGLPALAEPVLTKNTVTLAATNGRRTAAPTLPRNAASSMSVATAIAITEPQNALLTVDKDDNSLSFTATHLISDCLFFENNIPQVNEDLQQRCSLTRILKKWATELFPDAPDAEFLLCGIAQGFNLVENIDVVYKAECTSYRSALQLTVQPFLGDLLNEELKMGRITEQVLKPIRVNAIGAVPKKGSNIPRPITDYSRPFTCSVNSYIDTETFRFKTIDTVVMLSSPGCFYAIVDIKSAYRWVPVYPAHRQLQGLKREFDGEVPKYLMNNFLCFGLSCAPSIFHQILCSISRMMRKRNYNIVSYLYDFVLVVTAEHCRDGQQF